MMLQSRHFYSAHAYRQRVKYPIEYVVGTTRSLDQQRLMSPYSLIAATQKMGQQLFAPPNVKGWEGGKSWLNTATILARHNYAEGLSTGSSELTDPAAKESGFGTATDPLGPMRVERITDPRKMFEWLVDRVMPDEVSEEVRKKLLAYMTEGRPNNFTKEQRCRDVLHALMTLPEYQLA
jgi:hypothetical protein